MQTKDIETLKVAADLIEQQFDTCIKWYNLHENTQVSSDHVVHALRAISLYLTPNTQKVVLLKAVNRRGDGFKLYSVNAAGPNGRCIRDENNEHPKRIEYTELPRHAAREVEAAGNDGIAFSDVHDLASFVEVTK